ncbi:substrate-binding domain-containing protein [Peristeroidobacter agariperforans]|uniref:substrate-binding domain-containing protein n=1 Tax=Peristeroidobacter agariperforans TaxID=268404 RepID=UPI00101C2EE8|nr:substrate-binding domain-containing protein [Peristeroidobacter agariperforans]
MNDEFLKALRRDPPPQFARRLKQQLQAQDARAKRRSWSLRTRALVFLIVGSAFAGGMLVLEKHSSERAEPAQSQAQIAAAKSDPAAYRPRSLGPGFVPEGNDAAPLGIDNAHEPAGSPANTGFPAQSGPAAAGSAAAVPSPSEQTMQGGLIRSQQAARIAVSPLTDALVRSVINRQPPRKSGATPRVETIEADAALAALCAPGNARQFDMVVASRRIAHAEFATCRRNGIDRIIESKLGYQALVLTSGRDSTPMKLSASDVYLAAAKRIPDPLEPARFIDNSNVTWDQVDFKLEYRPIALFGPARATPLHQLFATALLEPGCNAQRSIERLRIANPTLHAELCHTVRGDRLYSEVEQTASLIPQNLWADPNAFVLVDYEFYRENRDQLSASALEGPEPSTAAFADGSYPLARPIYLYVDLTHLTRVTEAYDVMRELQSLERFARGGSGFVGLEEHEAKAQRSRPWQTLSESDLIPERSVPR